MPRLLRCVCTGRTDITRSCKAQASFHRFLPCISDPFDEPHIIIIACTLLNAEGDVSRSMCACSECTHTHTHMYPRTLCPLCPKFKFLSLSPFFSAYILTVVVAHWQLTFVTSHLLGTQASIAVSVSATRLCAVSRWTNGPTSSKCLCDLEATQH